VHQYYAVNRSQLRLQHSETFVQLDVDNDTEHFLAYSRKKARSSFKYKFVLPKLLAQQAPDYDKLHKWGLSESFLLSPDQFRAIITRIRF